MSRVEQIEQAIQELTPEEFAQLARRVYALEQERWDDASSGKLDFCWTKRTVSETPEP
jgi:hypothetical protein